MLGQADSMVVRLTLLASELGLVPLTEYSCCQLVAVKHSKLVVAMITLPKA